MLKHALFSKNLVGYRGTFRSSARPVLSPQNLSEAYVLFDTLAEYVREKDGQDPHQKTAERSFV